MTDLEMTRLCAEAIGWNSLGSPIEIRKDRIFLAPGSFAEFCYDPLHDDAQAMALVKKFRLFIFGHSPYWVVASKNPSMSENTGDVLADGNDLNRAIVECVAKMKEVKP